MQRLSKEVEDQKIYSRLATYDIFGSNVSTGTGFKITTPISKALEGHFKQEAQDRFTFDTDDAAIAAYRGICAREPNFPFGHYLLALALKDRGSQEWRPFALEARRIFRITTSFSDHNSAHDDALRRLDAELKN